MERNNLEATWREKLTTKDPDLKCPAHDAMSLAMINKTFVANMLISAGAKILCVTKVEHEYPVSKGSGSYFTVIGYADAFVEATSKIEGLAQFIIEAKPKIDNPFETMRQIKNYLVHCRRGVHGVLWCPEIMADVHEAFVNNRILVCSATIEELMPPVR